MDKPDFNEQWLTNGECSVCRRRNYCKKPCRAAKNRSDRFLRGAVLHEMVRTMMPPSKKM